MNARRAIDPARAYWLAMLAASTFGANMGDFWVDGLALDRMTSFGLLAAICIAAIVVDRIVASRTEAAYWTAIVALRAAATNLGDVLTHDLHLGYVLSTVVLGALAVAAASVTRASGDGRGTPAIDLRFWVAMMVAGVFGTVGGDLVSHSVGLYASSSLLCAVLAVFIAVRSTFGASLVAFYWITVLAERCAGTALGDTLASERALGLGLPIALACTGGTLVVALALRTCLGALQPHRPEPDTASPL
jgi:uncharacterized membrane-anchored protein